MLLVIDIIPFLPMLRQLLSLGTFDSSVSQLCFFVQRNSLSFLIRPDGIFIQDVWETLHRFLRRYPLSRHHYTLYHFIPARPAPTLSRSGLASSPEQL